MTTERAKSAVRATVAAVNRRRAAAACAIAARLMLFAVAMSAVSGCAARAQSAPSAPSPTREVVVLTKLASGGQTRVRMLFEPPEGRVGYTGTSCGTLEEPGVTRELAMDCAFNTATNSAACRLSLSRLAETDDAPPTLERTWNVEGPVTCATPLLIEVEELDAVLTITVCPWEG